CLLKVAAYAAQLEQFPRAIDIYEQFGALIPKLLGFVPEIWGPDPKIPSFWNSPEFFGILREFLEFSLKSFWDPTEFSEFWDPWNPFGIPLEFLDFSPQNPFGIPLEFSPESFRDPHGISGILGSPGILLGSPWDSQNFPQILLESLESFWAPPGIPGIFPPNPFGIPLEFSLEFFWDPHGISRILGSPGILLGPPSEFPEFPPQILLESFKSFWDPPGIFPEILLGSPWNSRDFFPQILSGSPWNCPRNPLGDFGDFGNFGNLGNVGNCSPLLKYSAKEHFFRAALCHCCVDSLNAKGSPGPLLGGHAQCRGH
ncbi:hypothetical protein DV515_00019220, partial [Chloebia gouldiae]